MNSMLELTLYGISVGAIIYFVLNKPWIIIRPSVWCAMLMTIMINGAAAFSPSTYAYPGGPELQALSSIDAFRLLSLIFPTIVFGIALITPKYSTIAKEIYQETASTSDHSTKAVFSRSHAWALGLLSILGGVLLLLYLMNVPLHSTGLWAIVFDPDGSSLAREASMTLVDNPVVRYGYTWYTSTIAPAIICLLWYIRKPRLLAVHNVLIYAAILLILGSVMLTGARGDGARTILVFGLTYLLIKGVYRGGRVLLFLFLFGLLLATILTIMREGRFVEFSFALFWEYLTSGIFSRVFIVPFVTGVYTNIYAQDVGLLGISNIRPLASLFGVEHIQLAREAGRTLIQDSVFYTHMNTSFLFDFQASFGLFYGMLVSIPALLVLDFSMGLFRRLKGFVLVSLYSVLLCSLLALCSTGYFVSLNSHGILWVIALAWLVGVVLKYGAVDRQNAKSLSASE